VAVRRLLEPSTGADTPYAHVLDAAATGVRAAESALAVDEDRAGLDLDPVARQPDQPLECSRSCTFYSRGSLKTTTSPRAGALRENPPREQRRAEGDRMAAEAVVELGDDDVVALEQVRLHRREGMV